MNITYDLVSAWKKSFKSQILLNIFLYQINCIAYQLLVALSYVETLWVIYETGVLWNSVNLTRGLLSNVSAM